MFRFIISLGIMYIALLGGLRLMAAMQYQDDATIFLNSDVCPFKKSEDNVCTVKGTLSHTFITGDMEIITPDGAQWIVPQTSFVGMVALAGHTRYEPFGRIFATVVCLGVFLLGALLAFGDSLLSFSIKVLEARLSKS